MSQILKLMAAASGITDRFATKLSVICLFSSMCEDCLFQWKQ